jgi:hypothetical protein
MVIGCWILPSPGRLPFGGGARALDQLTRPRERTRQVTTRPSRSDQAYPTRRRVKEQPFIERGAEVLPEPRQFVFGRGENPIAAQVGRFASATGNHRCAGTVHSGCTGIGGRLQRLVAWILNAKVAKLLRHPGATVNAPVNSNAGYAPFPGENQCHRFGAVRSTPGGTRKGWQWAASR